MHLHHLRLLARHPRERDPCPKRRCLQSCSAQKRDDPRPSGQGQERRSRLAIVDAILWDAKPKGKGSAAGAGWLRASWFVQAFHAAVALVMRALVLHVTDTEAIVVQDTVPGPWQPARGTILVGARCVTLSLVHLSESQSARRCPHGVSHCATGKADFEQRESFCRRGDVSSPRGRGPQAAELVTAERSCKWPPTPSSSHTAAPCQVNRSAARRQAWSQELALAPLAPSGGAGLGCGNA